MEAAQPLARPEPDAAHGGSLSGSAEAPSPYDLIRPARLTTPFVFASPHSGRLYPADLMAASSLDTAQIRRSEDALVDSLVAGAPGAGIPLIAMRYARAYVDVNREPGELDPAMFEDELPAFARGCSTRVQAGLGTIARVVAEGQEIYARKLTWAEAKARIAAVHAPYHCALERLLQEARDACGFAVLVDWHSMPSAAAGGDASRGVRGADVILGDRFGAACAFGVTRLVERELEQRGYRVARNAPYAGGYTTQFYGRPHEGVHALQIELNRGLYLDETTLAPTPGFARLASDLTRLCAILAACDWKRLA